jgi:coenzyme F420-reducing hydrogenase delta subunit
MKKKRKFTLALFHCQNIPGSSEKERQSMERDYEGALRLFPLPCSGRMEPLHLMKALEEFADAAYLIACPEGGCRYHEGNSRARKRVSRTAEILAEIGLEKDRVGIVEGNKADPNSLAVLAGELMAKLDRLGPSPVFGRDSKEKEKGNKAGSNPGSANGIRRTLKIGENRAAEMCRMEQR